MLVGTAVGAGVLGLPYAVSHAGFAIGIIMLLGLGLTNIILQLMFAEVTLRTNHEHQIPGYAGIYLGPYVKRLGMIVGLSAGYGTILAYIIASGTILQSLFGGGAVMWSLIYFATMGLFIHKGLGAIKTIEIIMAVFVAGTMIVIWLLSFPHIQPEHLIYTNMAESVQVYGILLFALSATIAIPGVRQGLAGREKEFPKVIFAANLFVIGVYTMFILFVLGATGPNTTPVATIGLGNIVGPKMLLIGNILALFTITTSCLTIGLAIRRLYQYDYGFSPIKSLTITLIIPLVVFLTGIKNFIQVLGIVGGIGLGLQSAIIIFSFWRARIHGNRKPEFTLGKMRVSGVIMLVVFLIGALLTLIFI